MHNSKTGIYSPNHHTLYTLHYPVHSSAISAYAPFSLKLTPKSTLPAKPPSPHSLALKLFPTIRKTFFNRSEERKIKKERSRKSTTIFGKLSRNHDCRSTGKRQPIFRINHRVKPMRWDGRFSSCHSSCRSRMIRSRNSKPRRNTIGSSKYNVRNLVQSDEGRLPGTNIRTEGQGQELQALTTKK